MILLALLVMMMSGQPAPAASTVAPPTAVVPAKPAVAATPVVEPPVSVRLESLLNGLKGRPQADLTSKLGPPDSIKQATDGQVLFWTLTLPGATVCGPNASGNLVCGRQGGGDCSIAVAFKTTTGMGIWKAGGFPAACEAVADRLQPRP